MAEVQVFPDDDLSTPASSDALGSVSPDFVSTCRTIAAALAAASGAGRTSLGDLSSELAVEVLRRAHAYDASRGSFATFCRTVARSRLSNLAAARYARCRDIRRLAGSLNEPVGLDGEGDERIDRVAADDYRVRLGGDPLPEAERVELATDVHMAVQELPPDLQVVCAVLSRFKAAEAARFLGIAPSTLYLRLVAIREHFEALGLDAYVRCDNRDAA